jgi:hypothetical protein
LGDPERQTDLHRTSYRTSFDLPAAALTAGICTFFARTSVLVARQLGLKSFSDLPFSPDLSTCVQKYLLRSKDQKKCGSAISRVRILSLTRTRGMLAARGSARRSPLAWTAIAESEPSANSPRTWRLRT